MKSVKRIFFINPEAGRKNPEKLQEIIKEACNFYEQEYIIIQKNNVVDMKKAVAEYVNDNNVVLYSVGGDGTLSTIAEEIIDGKAMLSIIPAGTGNDFEAALQPDTKEIDYMLINNEIVCLNILSVGLDVDVANSANKFKSKRYILSNKMAYNLGIVKAILNYHTFKVKINGKVQRISLIAVCNGYRYGGGVKAAPGALMDDGLLNVSIIDPLNNIIEVVTEFLNYSKGKHIDRPITKYFTTDQITIEALEGELAYNKDGEIIKGPKIDIKLVPKAIKIFPEVEDPVKQMIKGHPFIK